MRVVQHVAVLLMCGCSMLAADDKYEFSFAQIYSKSQVIEVVFEKGFPPEESVNLPECWEIRDTAKRQELKRYRPDKIDINAEARTVTLHFEDHAIQSPEHQYEVVWVGIPRPAKIATAAASEAQPVSNGQPAAPAKTSIAAAILGQYTAASSEKEATIYLQGSLITGVGSKPQYAWQAHLEKSWQAKNRFFKGDWGGQFDGIGREEKNIDPDSLVLSAFYRRYLYNPHDRPSANVISYDSNFAGFEFERKEDSPSFQKNSNFVSSHALTWSPSNAQFAIPVGSFTLTPEISGGVQVGNNYESFDSKQARGLIFREFYQAKFYFLPNKLGQFDRFNVNSLYRVLIPHRPEPFKASADVDPILTTKARHYVETNFNTQLAPALFFTIQYLYGSLPPSFTFQNHQVSLGITLALKPAAQ